jgi:hypothetical protein
MKATVMSLLGCLILASVCLVFAQSPVVRVDHEQLKWVPDPEGLGFSQAIVEGDPGKAGIYIVMVKFPPYVMSRPHFHGETRYATVIKGTWYTGEGNTFDPNKTVPLKAGSFMKHPSNTRHFDGSKAEEVIVQLMGMGPSTTTKVDTSKGLFSPSK